MQIRAHAEAVDCSYEVLGDGADARITITLGEALRGVAPGQAAVLYDGDRVIGSGTIGDTSPAR